MDSTSTQWSSKDEMDYLGKIGHALEVWPKLSKSERKERKIELLKGALMAYERRTRWGGIVKDAVVFEAKRLLAELR